MSPVQLLSHNKSYKTTCKFFIVKLYYGRNESETLCIFG